MSERAHFWIRVTAVGVILALQFGPRWMAPSKPAAAAVLVAATASR